MAKIFQSIQFIGGESRSELAVKLMDMQRQLENRIAALEEKTKDQNDRLEEVED